MPHPSSHEAPQIFGAVRLPAFFTPAAGPPTIVAIEGPNGAGKTTLCKKLAQELHVPHCLGTDEAWFAEPLKVRMIRDADWFASAMFFLSGCFEQSRVLRQWGDSLVVQDRSLWSTLAVHASEKPERLQTLIAVLEPVAREVQIPQLTIVLEASFDTCQARISQKSGTARDLDQLTATAAFHEREQAFYHWLANQSATVVFLDTNNLGEDEVARRAVALIRSKVGP